MVEFKSDSIFKMDTNTHRYIWIWISSSLKGIDVLDKGTILLTRFKCKTICMVMVKHTYNMHQKLFDT